MERIKAKNWYRWLWFSPLLTIPTFVYVAFLNQPGHLLICGSSWRGCNRDLAYRLDFLLGVLVSGLWHLVLLIPSKDKKSMFVQWHGRQALLLAGIRTLVPLVTAFSGDEEIMVFAIPVLIIIWLGGDIWGQGQAKRGDCWLMRRMGLEEELTKVEVYEKTEPRKHEARRKKELGSFDDIALEEVQRLTLSEEKRMWADDLIKIARFSPWQEDRHRAIKELHKRNRTFSTFVKMPSPEESEKDELEIEGLIRTVRFGSDRQLTKKAVEQLKSLGKTNLL